MKLQLYTKSSSLLTTQILFIYNTASGNVPFKKNVPHHHPTGL